MSTYRGEIAKLRRQAQEQRAARDVNAQGDAIKALLLEKIDRLGWDVFAQRLLDRYRRGELPPDVAARLEAFVARGST